MNAFPVYPAMGFGTPSLMYSPLMMAPQAPPRPQNNKLQNVNEKGSSKFQRPASQATSVKAEPGSAMGSMVRIFKKNFETVLKVCYQKIYFKPVKKKQK